MLMISLCIVILYRFRYYQWLDANKLTGSCSNYRKLITPNICEVRFCTVVNYLSTVLITSERYTQKTDQLRYFH